MNDIQAALGASQIKIDQYVKFRRKIAKCYDNKLKKLPLNLPY